MTGANSKRSLSVIQPAAADTLNTGVPLRHPN